MWMKCSCYNFCYSVRIGMRSTGASLVAQKKEIWKEIRRLKELNLKIDAEYLAWKKYET